MAAPDGTPARPPSTERGAISPARLGVGAACLLLYAVPLFHPPGSPPPGTVVPPDAWLLARIFPGVPAAWVAVRLAALAVAAVLLSGPGLPAALRPVGAMAERAGGTVRFVALGVAVLQACAAPWAGGLGPWGQLLYLAALGVPALLLAGPAVLATALRRWRQALPAGAVIAAWVVSRLVIDLGSPRLADVVDGWRGWLDLLEFVAQRKNVLTNLFDPNLPGVGGVLFVFHGVPLFQAGVLAPTVRAVQVFQIGSLALGAAGVAGLAHLLLGPGTSAIAAAVFLFAPYTLFVTIFPGPFLAGPLYVTAVALAALIACRWRSEAALAALGAATGVGMTFPSAVPVVACIVALTLWYLRRDWRSLGLGAATGLASFAAVVVPALGEILSPGELGTHFRWDGLISIIDGNLLGQLPLRSTAPAWANVSPRPFDVVVSALLAPFAHPRMGVRLWADAIFDPAGAALMAIGLAACVRSVRRSAVARALLLLFAAALAPALVSPVDIVDIVHAVALPVPAALLAAAGFVVVVRGLGRAVPTAREVAVAAIAACLGGTVLFDAVTPRTLPASSLGIMYLVLRPEAADRVIVLAYGASFPRGTRLLFTPPITLYGGPRPVGYFEWDGGDFPASDMAAAGKDLLFWSHGYDQDMAVREAICRQWPDATLYEIEDRAHLGRVHAAGLGGAPWEPADAEGRWHSVGCASRATPPGS